MAAFRCERSNSKNAIRPEMKGLIIFYNVDGFGDDRVEFEATGAFQAWADLGKCERMFWQGVN